MVRDLDEVTLKNAGRDYAAAFMRPTVPHPHNKAAAPIDGRGWVMRSLCDAHFKDEFDYVRNAMRPWLGPAALAEFDDEASRTFTPRSDDEYVRQLAERLAITPDGKPIPGKIGKVVKGGVVAGWRYVTHVWERPFPGAPKVRVLAKRPGPRIVRAYVHVGETPEEAAFRVTKRLQDQGEVIFPMAQWPSSMALATRISNEAAIAACDAIVDRLDEGTGAAILRILDGTQATDPDTAIGAQVTLALLVCSDPAFGAGSDANPGGRATASAITQDASADATGTASWFRASATNDGATSLDDHIDGSVGTGTNDMVLNTVSIVSGATVSISSWTVTMPES